MDEEILNGLNYKEIKLHNHAHMICGKVTKVKDGVQKEFEIDPGSFWLINGLGQLSDKAPESLVAESLKDIIIISKAELIEFLKSKK